jgi:FlaG/FlaF family flagellin (archaellin)
MVRIIGLIALIVAFTGGCMSQSDVVKLYEDPERKTGSYENLLIVGISNDRNLQQLIEDEVVRRIRAQQVDASPSYPQVDSSAGVLQGDIDRLSEQVGADAVLITHIVSVDANVDSQEGREEIQATCRRGDIFHHFLYDHEILKEPDSVRLAHTVVAITSLFDAATQRRIWTIQSTCLNKADLAEAIYDEAMAIARQLSIDELI